MTNDLNNNHWMIRYPLAVIAAVAGLFLRLSLTQWVGPDLPTYITFYPAVVLVALLVGVGPGIVTTLTAALITDYWILTPTGSIRIAAIHDVVALVFFVLMGVFMSVVAGRYRSIRSHLESLVATRTRELDEANRALKQQVSLVDPARAEIIARETERVLHDRNLRAAPPAPEAGVFQRAPQAAGTMVLCVGLLIVIGWVFDIEVFKRVLPGWVSIKVNTAICFVLTGFALLMQKWNIWRKLCAALIGAISLVTLVEYLTGSNLGLDQLFCRECTQLQTAYPGRMSFITATNFLLAAIALFLLGRKCIVFRPVGQLLALVVGITGSMVIIGYIYEEPRFYTFGSGTSMSLMTAILFVILSLGLLLSGSGRTGELLKGSTPGAQLVRRLLPAVLLVPIMLGWLCEKGISYGWYGDNLDTAVFAIIMTMLLSFLIWWTAGALDKSDALQKASAAQLRNQAELMDQAGEALIVRQLHGGILFWNHGAENLYGWSAAEAIGQRIHVLLHTEGLPAEHEDRLQQLRQWEGELQQTKRDGRRVIVESKKTAMQTADGQTLVLESTRDITLRREGEAAAAQLLAEVESYAARLKEANTELESSRRAAFNLMEDSNAARERAEEVNRELRLLQDKEKEDATRLARAQSATDTIRTMREGVILLTLEGTIISVNPAAEHLTGLPGSETIGCNIESLLTVFLTGADLRAAQLGLESLRNGRIPEFSVLQLRQPEGKTFHILPSISLLEASERGKAMAVLTLKDVTDLHETSRRLRELAKRLAVTEEEERWRISRYIHDTVIQTLSLSNIRLGSMAKPLRDAKLLDEAGKLAQIRELLGQAIDECRMVMSNLTPALLYELGLIPALSDLAQRLEKKHNVSIVVESEGRETSLPNPLRGLLFESTRELIMNALKHAGPCAIRVTVQHGDAERIVRVMDNGQGFDSSAGCASKDAAGGFGLLNIRQRVEGLGGWVTIESAPGKGTTATICVPVH